MIAARNMPPRFSYAYKQGELEGVKRWPVCWFCGEPSVFRANVAKTHLRWNTFQMYACKVCKEQLYEVAVKSFVSPAVTWNAGVEELWYQMSSERVRNHPTYLKWQGC